MQSNPQEQITLNLEQHQTTPISQTNNSNRRLIKKWLTIIICIILAVTGQCIARLLENYYFFHRKKSHHYGVWTQSLLQFIGFPILLFPFLLFTLLSFKEKKQLLITTDAITLKKLALNYPIIATCMFLQAYLSNSCKHRIPFSIFTFLYTIQLFFTAFISGMSSKIKTNVWSLAFAAFAGIFTLRTFSPASPSYDGNHKISGMYGTLAAAIFFSISLSLIMRIFENLITFCNASTSRKQPSFIVVLELLIFSSLLTTVILVVAVLISGEHHKLKRDMTSFSMGEIAYVKTMVGQVVAWQAYWVGIMGLMFAVSAVFSNVISVCTWSVVSLLVVFQYRDHYEVAGRVCTGIALGMAALSVVSYLYTIHKDNSEGNGATRCWNSFCEKVTLAIFRNDRF